MRERGGEVAIRTHTAAAHARTRTHARTHAPRRWGKARARTKTTAASATSARIYVLLRRYPSYYYSTLHRFPSEAIQRQTDRQTDRHENGETERPRSPAQKMPSFFLSLALSSACGQLDDGDGGKRRRKRHFVSQQSRQAISSIQLGFELSSRSFTSSSASHEVQRHQSRFLSLRHCCQARMSA